MTALKTANGVSTDPSITTPTTTPIPESGIVGFQPLVINGKLELAAQGGYASTQDLRTNVKQNLLMLMQTNPGERVMDPRFGAGIRRFLFEMNDESVYASIDSKIREQVSLYLPYIRIDNVRFDKKDLDRSKIFLSVTYSVPRLSLSDTLTTEVL